MIAAAVSSALRGCSDCRIGVQHEVAERLEMVRPTLTQLAKAGAEGRQPTVSGSMRAMRNVAMHNDHGCGAEALPKSAVQAKRRQRGRGHMAASPPRMSDTSTATSEDDEQLVQAQHLGHFPESALEQRIGRLAQSKEMVGKQQVASILIDEYSLIENMKQESLANRSLSKEVEELASAITGKALAAKDLQAKNTKDEKRTGGHREGWAGEHNQDSPEPHNETKGAGA